MLSIEFSGNRFIFRYRESAYVRKVWEKACGRDEGFDSFEHVMQRLKWFLE